MKKEPARLTGISLCSAGILVRRADFLPYDSSSPVYRAEKLSTAHARQETRISVKSTEKKPEKTKNFRWSDEMI